MESRLVFCYESDCILAPLSRQALPPVERLWPSDVDDDGGGVGDGSSYDCVHLFQERENKDEARSSYESHVKGGPKNNRALIFGDLVVSGLLQQKQKVWSWYCCSIQVLYLLNKIIA